MTLADLMDPGIVSTVITLVGLLVRRELRALSVKVDALSAAMVAHVKEDEVLHAAHKLAIQQLWAAPRAQ